MKYVQVKNSKALDAFVQRQCASLARRVSANPNHYQISMTLKGSSKNPEGKVNEFEAMGEVVVGRQKTLRVKKKNSDARKAIVDAVKALEAQVRRLTEKQERSRKTVGKSLKPVKTLRWELNSSSDH